jgi:hypothetical protein
MQYLFLGQAQLCIMAQRSIIRENETVRKTLLEEVKALKGAGEDSGARAFQDDRFDLQVHLDADQHVTAFHLGYKKGEEIVFLHWEEEEGLRFSGSKDHAPETTSDSEHGFNVVVVEREFEQRSHGMDLGIASFVLEKLRAYREGELAEDEHPLG